MLAARTSVHAAVASDDVYQVIASRYTGARETQHCLSQTAHPHKKLNAQEKGMLRKRHPLALLGSWLVRRDRRVGGRRGRRWRRPLRRRRRRLGAAAWIDWIGRTRAGAAVGWNRGALVSPLFLCRLWCCRGCVACLLRVRRQRQSGRQQKSSRQRRDS